MTEQAARTESWNWRGRTVRWLATSIWGASLLMVAALTLASVVAFAGPSDIGTATHEGEFGTDGIGTGSWSTGNITEYREGDEIRFRFEIDTKNEAALSGTLDVAFSLEDATCHFFDGSFELGAIEILVGPDVWTVAKVGSAVPSGNEWVQTIQIDKAAGTSGKIVARVNYTLKLEDNIGLCTGSSQHSRLQDGSVPGDVVSDGLMNVPVPGGRIILFPDITVTKYVDRDGDGTFESTASAGEFEFTLDGATTLLTNSSGTVVFEQVQPDGDHTITEEQIDFSSGTYSFDHGDGTSSTFVGSTATATVYAGNPSSVQNAQSNFYNTAQIPVIAVSKLADKASVSVAGEEITYTYEVSNPGNVSLTVVTLSDDNTDAPPSYVSGDDGNSELDIDETWIYTAIHTVTQAEIDAGGTIDNIATADSSETDPETATESVTVSQDPRYSIEKTVTDVDGEGAEASVDAAGDLISYSIVVTNSGNVTLNNVALIDALLEGANGTLGAKTESLNSDDILEVSEIWTYNGSYTVQQSDINDNGGGDGDIDNTATVSSDELADESDSEAVPISIGPNYSIDKTVTGVDTVGDGILNSANEVIDYQIVVTNDGNVSLTGVSVADPLLEGANGTLGAKTESLNNDDILEVSEIWTYNGSYTVQQSDLDDNGGGDGDIDNNATVSSDELADESDSEAVPISIGPDYSIDKTVTGVDTVGDGILNSANEVIDYQIVVTNDGNVSLTGVSVADPLLEGANGTLGAKTESLNNDDILEVGETWTYTGAYTVRQSDINDNGGGDGDIDNTATVSSNELADESDSASVPIALSGSIEIIKAGTFLNDGDADGVADVGETVTYTFTVENTGKVALTNVTVTDPKATVVGGPLASLAVGGSDSGTFTASYIMTQADIDAGNVDNTATVTGTPPSGSNVTNEDTETVTFAQVPSLTIDKTGDDGPVSVGDTITYQITVTNTGNITLHNVTATDPLTGLDTNLGSLAPQEVRTLNPTYAVTVGDLPGPLVNTATADSDETDPGEDDHSVEVLPARIDLSLTKTVDNASPQAGEIVSFKIVVANGPNFADATGVEVTDTLPAGYTFVDFVVSQGTYAYNGLNSIWAVGDLPVGSSAMLQVFATVLEGGRHVNPVEVTAADQDDIDSVPANASVLSEDDDDEVVVLVDTPTADLLVDKTVDEPIAIEGAVVTFTISVTNNGPGNATGVVLRDALPLGLVYISHSGSSDYSQADNRWEVGTLLLGASATLQISALIEDGTAGTTITNTALVIEADVEDPDESNNEDSADVTIVAADLVVTKTVDDPTPVEGDTIVWTVTVTNNGPVDATGVVLSDILPAGLTYVNDDGAGSFIEASGDWIIGLLLVAASRTLNITAEVDAGTAGTTITNTASVEEADQPDPDPSNNEDSVDIVVGETVAGSGGAAEECEGKVIISEIAWAGTAASPDDEWIEIRNIGGEPVDLTGWILRWRKKQPVTTEDFQWKVVPLSGELQASSTPICELTDREPEPAVEFVKREIDDLSWFVVARPVDYDESYMLLERRSDLTISNLDANIVYDDVAPYSMELSNEGDIIELLDANGEIVDTANAFPSYYGNWPAGNALTRGTMERIDPLGSDERENWHTNLGIITRGVDANGRPLIASADNVNSQTLEELELFADLNATRTLPGARLEVGLDLLREVRRETGWPWIRITRPGYNTAADVAGGGGQFAVPVYLFAGRYSNDIYWLGIDTAGLVPGDYLVWVVYGEGQTVLVPITVLD